MLAMGRLEVKWKTSYLVLIVENPPHLKEIMKANHTREKYALSVMNGYVLIALIGLQQKNATMSGLFAKNV